MAAFHYTDEHADSECANDDAQRITPCDSLKFGQQGVCLVLRGRRDAGRRFTDLRRRGLGELGDSILQLGDSILQAVTSTLSRRRSAAMSSRAEAAASEMFSFARCTSSPIWPVADSASRLLDPRRARIVCNRHCHVSFFKPTFPKWLPN